MLLTKPELSGSAIAKITFRNVFEELGGTEVGVDSLGTRHPRKKVPETGAAASPKIWLLLEQCLVFVLAENLRIPARFKGRSGSVHYPAGQLPAHPGILVADCAPAPGCPLSGLALRSTEVS